MEFRDFYSGKTQGILFSGNAGNPEKATTASYMFYNRARRQSGFPTFIPCQCQDANVLPKQRQSHQGDKLCDVSTVPMVARWPAFLARGSDADGEPHFWPPLPRLIPSASCLMTEPPTSQFLDLPLKAQHTSSATHVYCMRMWVKQS